VFGCIEDLDTDNPVVSSDIKDDILEYSLINDLLLPLI